MTEQDAQARIAALEAGLTYLVAAITQMEGETIRFRVAHSQTVISAEGELRFKLAWATEEALMEARALLAASGQEEES